MNRKIIFLYIAFTAIMVAIVGFNVNLVLQTQDKPSDLTLNRISALSTPENNPNNPCPDPYDVPNRLIHVEVDTLNLTANSNGEIYISVGGQSMVRGGYAKGQTVQVGYRIYNCSDVQEGSCCPQSSVRVEIM
jgi:hypothetical protein